MTPMIKAPDLGVVKSLAKALRKSLPDTAKIPHSRALEVSANAFGFSTWYACRTHFDRLNAGVFDPPASRDQNDGAAPEPSEASTSPVRRTVEVLSGELRTFRSGVVDVTGGVSCARSLELFLAPLLELGARYDRDLSRSWRGRPVTEAEARSLGPHVNTMSPAPTGLPHVLGRDTLLIGSTDPRTLYEIPDDRVPDTLRTGLLKVRREAPGGVVNLDRLQDRLRASSEHPHPEASFAVSSGLLIQVMLTCQGRISDVTAPYVIPSQESVSSGSAGDASSCAPSP